MVLVKLTDSAWLAGPDLPPPPAQSEEAQQFEAKLRQADEKGSLLKAELSSLQAEFAAACSAKAELVNEQAQLQKRVGCLPPQSQPWTAERLDVCENLGGRI